MWNACSTSDARLGTAGSSSEPRDVTRRSVRKFIHAQRNKASPAAHLRVAARTLAPAVGLDGDRATVRGHDRLASPARLSMAGSGPEKWPCFRSSALILS